MKLEPQLNLGLYQSPARPHSKRHPLLEHHTVPQVIVALPKLAAKLQVTKSGISADYLNQFIAIANNIRAMNYFHNDPEALVEFRGMLDSHRRDFIPYEVYIFRKFDQHAELLEGSTPEQAAELFLKGSCKARKFAELTHQAHRIAHADKFDIREFNRLTHEALELVHSKAHADKVAPLDKS